MNRLIWQVKSDESWSNICSGAFVLCSDFIIAFFILRITPEATVTVSSFDHFIHVKHVTNFICHHTRIIAYIFCCDFFPRFINFSLKPSL